MWTGVRSRCMQRNYITPPPNLHSTGKVFSPVFLCVQGKTHWRTNTTFASYIVSRDDRPLKSGQHTQRSGQHTLRSSQHTLRSGKHTLRSGQHTQRSGQHTLRSSQHTLRSGKHTLRSGQHIQRSRQHTLARKKKKFWSLMVLRSPGVNVSSLQYYSNNRKKMARR